MRSDQRARDPAGVNTVCNKLHRLTERDSMLAHYFALVWGLGLRLGYLATSGAKSDVIFLLGVPDFLQGRRNFACISRIFRDVTRDRQTTDDRRGDRNRRLSHCVRKTNNLDAAIRLRHTKFTRFRAPPSPQKF